MHYPETPALDNRLPGLLLQTAFADAVKPRGCISWSWGALIGLHGVQTAPHGSLGLPCGLYQLVSLSEGTALLFESEWVLYPAFGSPPTHPL